MQPSADGKMAGQFATKPEVRAHQSLVHILPPSPPVE